MMCPSTEPAGVRRSPRRPLEMGREAMGYRVVNLPPSVSQRSFRGEG